MEFLNESLAEAEVHLKKALAVTPEAIQRVHNRVMKKVHAERRRRQVKWAGIAVAGLVVAGALVIGIQQEFGGNQLGFKSNSVQGSGSTVKSNGAARQDGPPHLTATDLNKPFADETFQGPDGYPLRLVSGRKTLTQDGINQVLVEAKKSLPFPVYLPQSDQLTLFDVSFEQNTHDQKQTILSANYLLSQSNTVVALRQFFLFESLKGNRTTPTDATPVQVNGQTWYQQVVNNPQKNSPNAKTAIPHLLVYTADFGKTHITVQFPEGFQGIKQVLQAVARD